MITNNKFFVFFFLICISIPSHVLAKTITVKQDGSGTYTTIQAAINSASAGDTILVHEGTYNENLLISGKNGSSSNPYILKSARGEHVEINTGSEKYGINVNSDYWTIDGFDISGSGNSIIRCYGALTAIIRNCNISGNLTNSGNGILLNYGGCNNSKVSNCTVSISGSGVHGIHVNEADFVSVYDCVVNNSDIAIRFTRNSDCRAYRNYIHDVQGTKWGFYARDTQRILITNNVLEGQFNRAFCIYNYGGSGTKEDSKDGEISNNTIVGQSAAHGILFNHNSPGFLVNRNIIQGFSVGIFLVNGATSETCRYGDNLFYSNTTHVDSESSNPVDLGGNIVSAPKFNLSGPKPFPFYSLQDNHKDYGASFEPSSTKPSAPTGLRIIGINLTPYHLLFQPPRPQSI